MGPRGPTRAADPPRRPAAGPARAAGQLSGPPDFERLYAADPDPWRVGSRWYEARKRSVVLASLLQPRYRLAWDPACGTGHLSADLATRSDLVVASDQSPSAVALARERCAGLPVNVSEAALPDVASDLGRPDLVVLSEVVYYLDDDERAATFARVADVAAAVNELVCVHWSGAPQDAWLSGPAAQREVVEQLRGRGWAPRVHHVDDGFVLDTLVRGGA